MHGARARMIAQRVSMAEAAWAGANCDWDELQKYLAQLTGVDHALPPEALPGMLRSASRNLPRITREQYFQQRRLQ